MDFSNRCRGCLSNDEDTLRPLGDSSTASLFEECIGLKVCDGPGLPWNICGPCYGKCTSWSKFRQQCLETDALLRFKFGNLEKAPAEIAIDADFLERKSRDSEPPVPSSEIVDQEYEIIGTEPEIEENIHEGAQKLQQDLHHEIEIEIAEEYEVKEGIVEEEVLEGFFLTEEEQLQEIADTDGVNTNDEINESTDKTDQIVQKRKDYSCDKCNLQFRSTLRYEAHQRQHQGLKPEVCRICKGEFNSARALWRHMQKHVDTKKHVCKDCGKSYKFATSLTLHRKSHRDVPRHICDTCGKSFLRAHGLKSHLLTHTTETPFECDKCQKRFKNEIMLRNHVFRVHEGTKNFNCSDCDKAFTTGAELKIHQRSHTNQKPFKCSSCDKSYKTQSHLSVHFRASHTSDRPYACDLCPQTFAHSKVLKQHRLTHTGERPWPCTICHRSFRQKSTLLTHTKTHSKASPTEEISHESVVKLPQTLTTLE
ncbi:zinc finger protein 391-like [Ochlerotatus camptorhynchus]|uniref:zinc finger protein 391-like n=1 Tax=Ochlerotatus camptorhynchus TaxID=644619 RepID=UPI0031D67301